MGRPHGGKVYKIKIVKGGVKVRSGSEKLRPRVPPFTQPGARVKLGEMETASHALKRMKGSYLRAGGLPHEQKRALSRTAGRRGKRST